MRSTIILAMESIGNNIGEQGNDPQTDQDVTKDALPVGVARVKVRPILDEQPLVHPGTQLLGVEDGSRKSILESPCRRPDQRKLSL